MFPVKYKDGNYFVNVQESPMLSTFFYAGSSANQVLISRQKQAMADSIGQTISDPRILFSTNGLFASATNQNLINYQRSQPPNDSEEVSLDTLSDGAVLSRARRMFVPNERKDWQYWLKRLKNNDSARRSRIKRKSLEQHMEKRLSRLQKENFELKIELTSLKRRFGCGDTDVAPVNKNKTELVMNTDDAADRNTVVEENECTERPDTDCSSYTEEEYRGVSLSSLEWCVSDDGKSCSNDSNEQYFTQTERALPKIPHKFRLKMHIHSAFTQNDTS